MQHYHDPLEKKAFKPNWTQLRHVDQIKPYEQRMAQQADREAKREKESTTYKEQIKQRWAEYAEMVSIVSSLNIVE